MIVLLRGGGQQGPGHQLGQELTEAVPPKFGESDPRHGYPLGRR